MKLFKYWNMVGTLTEIEDYVRVCENNSWNCEPIPFKADVYGLIKGRHNLPVEEYLLDELKFGRNLFMAMENSIAMKLSKEKENESLVIYVTGYTPALIAAINAARRVGYIEIVLRHHDKYSDTYINQWVY